MRTLIETVRDLVGEAAHRRVITQIPGTAGLMPEQQLEELAVFNGADFIANSSPEARVEVLADGRHIAVTTPSPIWSYAAHLMLDDQLLLTAGDLLLRIDLWVNQGVVNVGVLGLDDQFIAHETRTRAHGRTAVNLVVKGDDHPTQIVVRNAGHGAAKAVVERVQAYRRAEDPYAEAVRARAPTSVSPSSRPLRRAFGLFSFPHVKTETAPLVSLILTVKNGLPYLDEALDSVRRQSYRNIELIVQDCLSTDGSSERLASFDGARVDVRREADGGIGDANNRALKRCHGDILGTIDSDNLLEANAVAYVVEHFAAHPADAAVYGSVRMISAEGAETGIFSPGAFDFLRFVSCDLVPPWSTAFFNKMACGDSLLLDAGLKTCVDYDTWLRLSHLPIAFLDKVLGSTRLSDNSMTCRPETYEQYCRDKTFALRRYAETCAHEPLRAALIRHGLVGIYCWAAESVKRIAPERTELIADFHERANTVDPASPQLTLTAQRLF